MVVDLLPSEHLNGLLSILRRSPEELSFTRALLDLTDWLDGNRLGTGMGLTASDQALLHQTLVDLDGIGRMLEQRLMRPPCLYSDTAVIVPTAFVTAGKLERSRQHWKPERALWTSPLAGEGHSAWSLRALLYGDGLPHAHNLVLVRPPPERAYLVGELAQADSLLQEHGGTPLAALASLHRDGYAVVDFTWRCVLQAEISVLRGEREQSAFPCGLGVECSMWLDVPAGPVRVLPAQNEAVEARPSGWFRYG